MFGPGVIVDMTKQNQQPQQQQQSQQQQQPRPLGGNTKQEVGSPLSARFSGAPSACAPLSDTNRAAMPSTDLDSDEGHAHSADELDQENEDNDSVRLGKRKRPLSVS